MSKPTLLRIALGVDVSYVRASIDEMTATYGSVGGFFADALGFDTAGQQQLVATLTH